MSEQGDDVRRSRCWSADEPVVGLHHRVGEEHLPLDGADRENRRAQSQFGKAAGSITRARYQVLVVLSGGTTLTSILQGAATAGFLEVPDRS